MHKKTIVSNFNAIDNNKSLTYEIKQCQKFSKIFSQINFDHIFVIYIEITNSLITERYRVVYKVLF